MKKISLCLLVAGLVLTLLLLFFFSHLFITKQAQRTAIERSLGMRAAQCRWSMLSGFALLIFVGALIGSVAGTRFSGRVSVVNAGQSYYETTYTEGLTNTENEIAVEEAADTQIPAVFSTVLIMAAGVGIAWCKMNRSLKREPMQLLSERQEES